MSKQTNMLTTNDLTIIMPHLGETKEQEVAFNESYASLRESSPEIRIVVAKNGGACTHPRDLRIVSQGQCKAVNAAVAMTNTRFILITNDDMIYPPGWFEIVKDMVDTWLEEVVCFSPKLIEPRPGAPTFETHFCGGAGGDFDKPKFFEYVKTRTPLEERYKTGFNFPVLMHRSLWDTVGGYDINYDPWGSNSDSDLEYKIRLAAVQPYQLQNWLVYHFSQTSGTFNPSNDSYRMRNYAYFKEKWGFERTDNGIWEANFNIPTVPERIFTPDWEKKYGQSY